MQAVSDFQSLDLRQQLIHYARVLKHFRVVSEVRVPSLQSFRLRSMGSKLWGQSGVLDYTHVWHSPRHVL